MQPDTRSWRPIRFGKTPTDAINEIRAFWSGATVFEDSPVSDFLFRMISPTRVTKYRPHPGDLMLAKWNRTKPAGEKEVEIPPIPTSYEVRGTMIPWEDNEYEQLCRLTGQIANHFWRESKFDQENPTAEQIDALKFGFSEARAAAKAYLRKNIGVDSPKPMDVERVGRDIRLDMLDKARKTRDAKLEKRKLGERTEDWEARKADWNANRKQAVERIKREARRIGEKVKPLWMK